MKSRKAQMMKIMELKRSKMILTMVKSKCWDEGDLAKSSLGNPLRLAEIQSKKSTSKQRGFVLYKRPARSAFHLNQMNRRMKMCKWIHRNESRLIPEVVKMCTRLTR